MNAFSYRKQLIVNNYVFVSQRLEPVIIELERQRSPVVVIAHQVSFPFTAHPTNHRGLCRLSLYSSQRLCTNLNYLWYQL